MNKNIIGKTLMILLAISLFAALILIVSQVNKKTPTTTDSSSVIVPTPTPTETRPQSRWATESGVLEIEANLKNLSDELVKVDLKESRLFPPVLDMKVKF